MLVIYQYKIQARVLLSDDRLKVRHILLTFLFHWLERLGDLC